MKKIKRMLSLILIVTLLSLPVVTSAQEEQISNASAGVNNSFFVKMDGTLWATGSNESGKLGTGNDKATGSMIQVADQVKQVSAGGKHTLILKQDNSLWAVGDGSLGQLGNGSTNGSFTFVKIMDDVLTIDAGYSYSAAVKTDGTLWAWGYNNKGLFLPNEANVISTPTQIATDCKDVACGMYGLLILKQDGTLWKKFSDTSHVSDQVSDVVTGREHYAYLSCDSSLSAWGLNQFGQLGDGTNESRTQGVLIATDVSKVAAGYSHTLFTKQDGSLWATGFNEYGQLGDGTTQNRNKPVFIMDHVTEIDSLAYHNIAITSDGFVWGWGDNQNGQLTSYNKKIVASPAQLSVAPFGGDPSAWAVGEVNNAKKLSLITTEISGNYQKNITREEFVDLIIAMLKKAGKLPSINEKSPFADTSNPNVALAYSLGIVSGTGESTFSPYLTITRQEISAMFYRLIQKSYPNYQAKSPDGSKFADDNKIAGWASESVYFASANGIVFGVGDNLFDPEGKCTGEQAILLTLRTYNACEGK